MQNNGHTHLRAAEVACSSRCELWELRLYLGGVCRAVMETFMGVSVPEGIGGEAVLDVGFGQRICEEGFDVKNDWNNIHVQP